jgi:hypothetical protein
MPFAFDEGSQLQPVATEAEEPLPIPAKRMTLSASSSERSVACIPCGKLSRSRRRSSNHDVSQILSKNFVSLRACSRDVT